MPSRKQNLEIVYQRAMDTIAEGDWQTAERILQQLQKVEHNYRDTVKMLRFVQATLAAQQAAATDLQFDELAIPPEPAPEEPAPKTEARTLAEKPPEPEAKPSQPVPAKPPAKKEKEPAPDIQAEKETPASKKKPASESTKKTAKAAITYASAGGSKEEAAGKEKETLVDESALLSEQLHIETGKQAEVEEFLHELQEEPLPYVEKPPAKEGFRLTRRTVMLLASAGLIIFIALAYLGSSMSSSKPLTMKERMETLAPPTPTIPPATAVPGAATLVPPPATATPATPTLTFTPPPPTDTPTITPTLGLGSTMLSEVDGMTMIYIPAGEFLMGPAKIKIYLDSFWIAKTEVSNGMYIKCVEEGACPPPSRETYKNSAYADHPVIWVNWFQAQAYCHWTDQRLPTEAEWEKAARGTDGRLYPWGQDPPASNLVNICAENCPYIQNQRLDNDGYKKTIPVGTLAYGASPYGVLDMAGNVWEWTADWYDEQFYYVPPTANPLGAQLGKTRVIRGGSWTDREKYIQTFHRDDLVPQYTLYNIGFRCAMTP